MTLSAIGGLLFVVGFAPYILAIYGRDFLGDKIKPTRPVLSTWLIWASLNTLILVIMYFDDAVNGLIVCQFVLAWTVALLALWYGNTTWQMSDVVLVIVFGLSLIVHNVGMHIAPELVQYDNNLVLALMMFGASITMFYAVWENPKTESLGAWIIYFLASVVTIWAMPSWTTKVAAQPFAFCVIATIMLGILVMRTWKIVRR